MEDAAFKKSWRMLLAISFVLMVLAPLEYLNVIKLTRIGLRPRLNHFPIWLYVVYALPVISIPCYLVIRRSWVLGYKKWVANRPGGDIGWYRTLVIMRMALVTSSYIYGLFIYFLTGGTSQMYYFYAIGILLSPFAWPRKQEYFGLLKEAQSP